MLMLNGRFRFGLTATSPAEEDERPMKKIACRPHVWLVALLLAGLSAALLYAVVVDDQNAPDLFNYDLYNATLTGQVHGVADIVADYECAQLDNLPIAPPDPSIALTMDGGLLAFNPNEFSGDFLRGLIPIEQAAITLYPITVYEDAGRRQRVILNAKGEAIATLPAPGDYDPQWYVKEVHPDLTTMDKERSAWPAAVYDPSRITASPRQPWARMP